MCDSMINLRSIVIASFLSLSWVGALLADSSKNNILIDGILQVSEKLTSEFAGVASGSFDLEGMNYKPDIFVPIYDDEFIKFDDVWRARFSGKFSSAEGKMRIFLQCARVGKNSLTAAQEFHSSKLAHKASSGEPMTKSETENLAQFIAIVGPYRDFVRNFNDFLFSPIHPTLEVAMICRFREKIPLSNLEEFRSSFASDIDSIFENSEMIINESGLAEILAINEVSRDQIIIDWVHYEESTSEKDLERSLVGLDVSFHVWMAKN